MLIQIFTIKLTSLLSLMWHILEICIAQSCPIKSTQRGSDMHSLWDQTGCPWVQSCHSQYDLRHLSIPKSFSLKRGNKECLGGSVSQASDPWLQLRSWLQRCETKPCVGFRAGHGACLQFSLSLCPFLSPLEGEEEEEKEETCKFFIEFSACIKFATMPLPKPVIHIGSVWEDTTKKVDIRRYKKL